MGEICLKGNRIHTHYEMTLLFAINRSENWTYIVLVQSRSLEMSIRSPSLQTKKHTC